MKLMREIRFSVLPDAAEVTNSWAGWPSATAISPYLTLQTVVRGTPDTQAGYLCNVQSIDRAVRRWAVPVAVRLCQDETPPPSGETLLLTCWDALHDHMPPNTQLDELRLSATPFLKFSKHSGDTRMVSVTESFEFSASHRLYNLTLSEEENRALFGKCANPNGHGHNYVVEVTVRGEPDTGTGRIIHIHDLELIVRESVVDRFDHKHLNLDCPEFAELNPSVENITQVIWNLLDSRFPPAELAKVRVWETPKTYAEIEQSD